MTHMGPVRDSDGKFTVESATYICRCNVCQKDREHKAERWESNCESYVDFRYTCTTCGAVFWVDGPDS